MDGGVFVQGWFFVGINVFVALVWKALCKKRGVKCCRVALLKRRIMYIMYSLVCCGTRKHVFSHVYSMFFFCLVCGAVVMVFLLFCLVCCCGVCKHICKYCIGCLVCCRFCVRCCVGVVCVCLR